MGGAWYAINGWLTWALGELDGVVPRRGEYALDELERNTLAAHARAFPTRWNGVLSIDDACNSWFAPDPGGCGIGLEPHLRGPDHAPARLDPLRGHQARRHRAHGATATGSGRACRCGASPCACRGWASTSGPGASRGYVRPSTSGRLVVEVERPGPGAVRAWVDGRRVRASVRRGLVRLRIRARAGRASDFAVVSGARR